MTVLNAPLGRCLVVLLALTIVVGCESKSGETQETPTGQEGPPNAGPLEGEDVAQGPVQGDALSSPGDVTAVSEDSSSGPQPPPDTTVDDGLCKTDLECEDLDPCTLDLCDLSSGACAHAVDVTNPDCQEAGDLPAGANAPCDASELPGSSDPAITACVCAIDPYCCDTMWDGICVTQADTVCDAPCSCDEPGADIGCSSDTDCQKCDSGDLCQGTWSCDGGLCVSGLVVECPPSEIGGCVVNQCDPWSGACEVIDNGSCEDADPCTDDACDMETGQCSNELACGTNHPCESAPYPTSQDEAITACVCGGSNEDANGDGQPDFDGDSWCCDNGWDSLCVSEAEDYCGAICDCTEPSVNLGCTDDGDCSWCGGDVCVGLWSCHDGLCGLGPGLECPASEDIGCLKNTCNPFDELCELTPSKEHCDDHTACSVDHCNVETGACSHEELSDCSGEPPYECLGYGEISAEGCAYVESFEGCCDPWGRAVWCNFNGVCLDGVCVAEGTPPPAPCADATGCTDPAQDCIGGYCLLAGSAPPETCTATDDCGDTMCVDCAATDPYCGWTGTWYLCGTEGVASEDPVYPMQCPGLTYGE